MKSKTLSLSSVFVPQEFSRSRGPLDKSTNKNTIFPFVFLLGNHSSGKSSFVNYILNRKVQTAGVAPTDDSFTIIAPGPRDVDRDGPSFIGDPDMGFSGLKSFGPTLIHHTQLKVRTNTAITDFMIVDTPGMIDSPLIRDSYSSNQSQKPSSSASSSHDEASRQYYRSMINANMDRGYNFEDVIKWYAERADVILLFFDPDKPGTTGETLSILTNSLQGMDHKLHIILNKADQFKRIHDFARAYGSLCWNLSKVIPRKDLPRIYTMCLPTAYQAASSGDQSTDEQHNLGQGLADLEATREEVVKEVSSLSLPRPSLLSLTPALPPLLSGPQYSTKTRRQ
jgi:GTPase SAR1 family protein